MRCTEVAIDTCTSPGTCTQPWMNRPPHRMWTSSGRVAGAFSMSNSIRRGWIESPRIAISPPP
ncbi:hypothetical protein CAP40_14615 [Sphingomonas sp. IBVSS2]|nr:hypothetical protein CAP40_14615 [Sphingomonas sp. IBVSS2]